MSKSKAGWVKIHRNILEWEWYKDIPTKVLFLHIIITANHAPKKWRGRTINRGQKWTSLNTLSEETGLSVKQVRTAMKKLEKTQELASERANEGTMITICKYDTYQASIEDEGQANGQAEGTEGAEEGHGKGKRGALNKKENNSKTSKKKEFQEPFLGKNSEEESSESVTEQSLEHPPLVSTALGATDVATLISDPALAAALLNYHQCQRDRGHKIDAYTVRADISRCLAMAPADAISAIDTAISGGHRTFLSNSPSTGAGKGAHPEVYQADSRSVDYSEGLTK